MTGARQDESELAVGSPRFSLLLWLMTGYARALL